MASLLNIYRISREKYIGDLSGLGAKMYGGRWNRPGVAVLYTSAARSLALLELIVHFTSRDAFQQTYKFATLSLDSDAIQNLEEDISKLNIYQPNNEQLWRITDDYFFSRNTLCLRVPSVLVPGEFNYLLNPIHRDFHKVEMISTQAALFDSRFMNLIG